jgi:hypothetical protein
MSCANIGVDGRLAVDTDDGPDFTVKSIAE